MCSGQGSNLLNKQANMPKQFMNLIFFFLKKEMKTEKKKGIPTN